MANRPRRAQDPPPGRGVERAGSPASTGDSFDGLTFAGVLERLAAPAPAPAGASAAALAAAMAASLVMMIGRGTSAWLDGNAVAARASDLRARLVTLAKEDARSVARLLELSREPASGDGGQNLALGLLEASRPPLAIAEAAAEIVELAADAATNGKPIMRADAAVAAVLARAAATSALLVIETNLNAASAAPASAESSVLLQQARDAMTRLRGHPLSRG